MTKKTIRLAVLAVLASLLMVATAWAAPAAEVKAAKGVEKFEPVEPGDTFNAKDTVWVWSKVTGAEGTTIKHVWKHDGKDEWSASLDIKSASWVTHSRRTVSAGSWTVEVQAQDGSKIGEVSFTVK